MLNVVLAAVIYSLIQASTCSIFFEKFKITREDSPTGPPAPEWPPYFVSNWTMFATPIADPSPPYRYYPPAPFRAGRGQTYYDWTTRNIIEIYQDFCIPLFDLPEKINWTCHFLNANNTAYLITTQNDLFPPCCIFGNFAS